MIFTNEELTALSGELNTSVENLNIQVNGIEDFIRGFTNNSFVVRSIRQYTPSVNGKLDGITTPFKVGDTVLITKSMMNDGVYTIVNMDGTLDRELYDSDTNCVTLVRYPQAIKSGALKLLRYSAKMDTKLGIASETLSRHSVSYANPSGNSIGGYPAHMMSFLQPFMKARF